MHWVFKSFLAFCFLALFASIRPAQAQSETPAAPVYSELWGKAGEKWAPKGPIKDFTDVGYKQGDQPIPDWPVKTNVRDFGAKGDGKADNSEAFRKAIAACPAGGAILIPDGTYRITDYITITKSEFVLRGQSRDKTILFFPQGLEILHPKRHSNIIFGHPVSAWAYSGGFLWFTNCHDVGVENLTLRFPDDPYLAHHMDVGDNALQFSGCRDSWVRKVTFYNVDTGAYVGGCQYITIQDTLFDCYPGRFNEFSGCDGHHGISLGGSNHCLVDRFEFRNRIIHELCLDGRASNHNVFSNGKGLNLHFDHHNTSPYGNLWTQIDAGDGEGMWANNTRNQSGGRMRAGSTKDEIYWNITARRPQSYPDETMRGEPMRNVAVGFPAKMPALKRMDGPWYEAIDPAALRPANIYYAMMELRKKPKP